MPHSRRPPSSAPTPTPTPEPENAALYRQLALYIRQGLVDYKKPGVYTLSFGPVDRGYCQAQVERADGEFAAVYYGVSWDEERDWYSIGGGRESFLNDPAGFDSYGWDGEEIVYTQVIDTEKLPTELPRFDTPPVPVEIDARRPGSVADMNESKFYRRTYHYIDERMGLDFVADYPQRHEYGATEVDLALNSLLRRMAVEEQFFQRERDMREGWAGAADVSYQITREDENYFSARFCTYINFQGAAHPSDWEWAVTVDRKTGERLALSDVLDWDGDSTALLGGYHWTSLGNYLPVSDMTEYAYMGDFYLTEESLGLVVMFGRYYDLLETPLKNLPLKRPV